MRWISSWRSPRCAAPLWLLCSVFISPTALHEMLKWWCSFSPPSLSQASTMKWKIFQIRDWQTYFSGKMIFHRVDGYLRSFILLCLRITPENVLKPKKYHDDSLLILSILKAIKIISRFRGASKNVFGVFKQPFGSRRKLGKKGKKAPLKVAFCIHRSSFLRRRRDSSQWIVRRRKVYWKEIPIQ